MSRRSVVTVLALISLARVTDLSACGDKFLLLGRAVGYEQILKASKPGMVLIYSTPGLPSAFSDGRFSALMELAGHRHRSVRDRQSLEQALSTAQVDVVLADVSASAGIADAVRASSTALVVPVLVDVPAAQRADLERKFGCVLSLPADGRRVISTLDKAMKLRAKRS